MHCKKKFRGSDWVVHCTKYSQMLRFFLFILFFIRLLPPCNVHCLDLQYVTKCLTISSYFRHIEFCCSVTSHIQLNQPKHCAVLLHPCTNLPTYSTKLLIHFEPLITLYYQIVIGLRWRHSGTYYN